MAFAIKAGICDPRAKTFALSAQKTMYGGKHIAEGDTVFVFASENEGGQGLIARGVVTSAEAIAKKRGIIRQTPRVSLTIRRTEPNESANRDGDLGNVAEVISCDLFSKTQLSMAQRSHFPYRACLERDDFRMNHHRALAYCLSMISAQTRSAFVARENRYPLF